MIDYEQWKSLCVTSPGGGCCYYSFYFVPRSSFGSAWLFLENKIYSETPKYSHWAKDEKGREFIYSTTFQACLPIADCFMTEEEAMAEVKRRRKEG